MTNGKQNNIDAGRLGMRLFLLSLSVLFLASIAGYWVVHSRTDEWIPTGIPRVVAGFWISTFLILISSVTIESALRSARRNQQSSLRGFLTATFALGIAFLVSQILNWSRLLSLGVTDRPGLYAFTLFVLTGLHAAHVLGGLIQLSIISVKALRGAYSAESHAGVLYGRMYWHFLAVIWTVMFIVLFLLA